MKRKPAILFDMRTGLIVQDGQPGRVLKRNWRADPRKLAAWRGLLKRRGVEVVVYGED